MTDVWARLHPYSCSQDQFLWFWQLSVWGKKKWREKGRWKVSTPYLQCFHPTRLFDLIVENWSVFTHGFVPCSQANSILTKRREETALSGSLPCANHWMEHNQETCLNDSVTFTWNKMPFTCNSKSCASSSAEASLMPKHSQPAAVQWTCTCFDLWIIRNIEINMNSWVWIYWAFRLKGKIIYFCYYLHSTAFQLSSQNCCCNMSKAYYITHRKQARTEHIFQFVDKVTNPLSPSIWRKDVHVELNMYNTGIQYLMHCK